ncbi:hypothetical protein UR09_03070 [Candidatus Nitromaritima sp. SCGC AAA799-A02]|nr:hypothetical protein UZ36_06680 [Candidatus Nitromaritima sp. SCGC AAA799-C22]KMP11534.1 hypothetical protein UR09_03070 [Candidatus Nitromaritima sp. SCGC AAA799-A02]
MSPFEDLFRSPPRFLSVILQVIVFLYAFTLFSYVTADPDLWGHIKFGEEIWDRGSLPETNSHAYTAPDHPWINHEWLTEVLFFLIYRFSGSTGLLAFKLAIGLFIVHLLSRLYFKREKNIYIYTFYFFLIIPVMAPGFMARPHLITFLSLTILMFILHEFFDGNRRPLSWSPLLFLIWTNCHGGVVAGIAIYGLVTLIEGTRCWLTRKEDHHKKLITYFALSALAVLIHPQGTRLWVFLYQSLSLPRNISEWDPVPILSMNFWEFKLLIIFLLTTFLRQTKKRFWEVALIMAAVMYGFKHQRHTVLTMIVITPYLLLQFAELTRDWNLDDKFARLSVDFHQVIFAVLFFFSATLLYSGIDRYRATDFKILVAPGKYPVYAAQFMKANNLAGNILAPFDWGEYMIWKFPDSKVSVDGRFRTAYPEDVINNNLDFSAGGEKWKALLSEYPTDIVLTRKPDGPHDYLTTHPDWTKIYEDPVSMIFIRSSEPPGPVLKRYHNKELIQVDSKPSLSFPG